jgi:3-deoxy-7-phosphoheptulonate synthase
MSHLPCDFAATVESPLIKPDALIQALPRTVTTNRFIHAARVATRNIVQGQDKRLLVVVGPCSIHDENSTLEYAALLAQAAHCYRHELFLVMRAYFEKPRTLLGWKGLISDPWLDGSFDINHGLHAARKILLQLANLGVPAATEFLDNIIPHYLQDLISWSAIGARTSASQLHRELASGLAMPVGFKNSTDGNVQVAVDAVHTARYQHSFLGISPAGDAAILHSAGNNACHIVLRGSQQAANYFSGDVSCAVRALAKAGLVQRVMIDCSHGNSMKDFTRQPLVIDVVAEQIRQGSLHILGVMLESHLRSGRQNINADKPLIYGQSVTDACLSWQQTVPLLEKLATAVSHRD